jgi:hypothetical protein
MTCYGLCGVCARADPCITGCHGLCGVTLVCAPARALVAREKMFLEF